MKRRLLLATMMISLTGCAGFTGRNFLSDSNEGGSFFSPRDDFPVMAGDTGAFEVDPIRSKEDMERDRSTYALEKELAELEDAQSESNLELYNQYKNQFRTTSEKIYYLNLPKGERESYLVSKGMIKPQMNRYSNVQRAQAIKHSDVMMGMSKNDVVDSWGRPARVEVAGNPSYENERWAYSVNGATKYIYFESGKVDGWE